MNVRIISDFQLWTRKEGQLCRNFASMSGLINENPIVYSVSEEDKIQYTLDYENEDEREQFTADAIFHYIR